MGDARHHRYPQSPRQLSKPGRCGAFGWKRDVGAAQRGRLGGAFRLAAGPGLWPRSGERWRDDAPDPPRIGQSFWRAFRGAEECAGTHRSGDEISRRALWPQMACGENQIGRASCRERVCKYVEIWGVAVSLNKKNNKKLTIKRNTMQ